MWGMIVAVVAIEAVASIISKKFKIYKEVALARSNSMAGSKDLMARIERMEERIANIETLVIEREKRARFDEALHERSHAS